MESSGAASSATSVASRLAPSIGDGLACPGAGAAGGLLSSNDYVLTVEVGVQRLVVPEAMQIAWEAAREGTVAAAASLELVEIPAEARCTACDHAFPPAIDDYRCPACGVAAAEIVKAGQGGQSGASYLFGGLGLAAVWELFKNSNGIPLNPRPAS